MLGTHDITGASCGINGYLSALEHNIKNNKEITQEDLLKTIEGIRNSMKRIKQANDYLYEKLKELQENGDQPRTEV